VPFSNEIVPAFFGTTQLLGGGNHAAVVAFGNAIFQRSSARTIKSRYRAQRAAMLSGGLPIALAICRSEHAQCVRRAGNKSLACSIAAIALRLLEECLVTRGVRLPSKNGAAD
jgi:hypothetical protein